MQCYPSSGRWLPPLSHCQLIVQGVNEPSTTAEGYPLLSPPSPPPPYLLTSIAPPSSHCRSWLSNEGVEEEEGVRLRVAAVRVMGLLLKMRLWCLFLQCQSLVSHRQCTFEGRPSWLHFLRHQMFPHMCFEAIICDDYAGRWHKEYCSPSLPS